MDLRVFGGIEHLTVLKTTEQNIIYLEIGVEKGKVDFLDRDKTPHSLLKSRHFAAVCP